MQPKRSSASPDLKPRHVPRVWPDMLLSHPAACWSRAGISASAGVPSRTTWAMAHARSCTTQPSCTCRCVHHPALATLVLHLWLASLAHPLAYTAPLCSLIHRAIRARLIQFLHRFCSARSLHRWCSSCPASPTASGCMAQQVQSCTRRQLSGALKALACWQSQCDKVSPRPTSMRPHSLCQTVLKLPAFQQ